MTELRYALGTVCKAHHELGCICSSGIWFQHAVHDALAGKQHQGLPVQFLDEQQRRHYCGNAEQSLQGGAPAGEDLSKEVPPHSNVGGGVWALHWHSSTVAL